MSYETALKHAGIKVETVLGWDEFYGETPSGKRFYLRTTCYNSNDYWTIDIAGKTLATRCCFRTAMKKIKAN